MITAEDLIRILQLKRHPLEGGYYRETYRSECLLPGKGNHEGSHGKFSLGTAIYYLLTPESFSEMHRLKADEMFHFYLGDPVEMLHLFPRGGGRILKLGNDIESGCLPQVLVPGNAWQGCRLIPGGRFALMGTTMSPGFDFADYESGDRSFLISKFPRFKRLIFELTRGQSE